MTRSGSRCDPTLRTTRPRRGAGGLLFPPPVDGGDVVTESNETDNTLTSAAFEIINYDELYADDSDDIAALLTDEERAKLEIELDQINEQMSNYQTRAFSMLLELLPIIGIPAIIVIFLRKF